MRNTSAVTSSSVGRALLTYTIRLARNASSASTDETRAPWAMPSTLVQVLFDPLRLAQQVRGMLIGDLDKFLQRFHRLFEFVGELGVFLVLPGIAQGGEARLQRNHLVLQIR